MKLRLLQRLGENVDQLISSGNVAGLDALVLQAISDEVVLGVDVLASLMEDRARADLLSTFSSTTSTFLPRSSASILDSHSA